MKHLKQILVTTIVTIAVLGFTFPMMPDIANAAENQNPEVEIETTSKPSYKRAFLDQAKKDANWGNMTLQE